MPPKQSINAIPFLLLRGGLKPEERTKPAGAVNSLAGTTVECTFGRRNILPLEPSSVSIYGLRAPILSTPLGDGISYR